ncbi:WD40-repeat-containing domain protein [Suillus subaureus]|uniref:WD40-repeat-containing domain protein n=1 Tax=Suillus subaureus TaxID=48587 RepID=A0A9P7JFD7_9AGAM|nr:WD40-repeat-containing domain protein [Suillus subaureus]KAG1819213.1 WD40-repeat-containing domain protein [Suillus subaureus]
MRYRTLEIRWHDSKPISTCDFQPVPFKKARPTQEKNFAAQSYRLATGGEDNHVRIWMVHPNILPLSLAEGAGDAAPRPARVEYLATLSRHSAAVNVVRFSPNGEFIASAGDDGMIIIWAPSSTPQTATYGSDLTADELQYEKEYWKPRTTFRCTTMQVYDLAWSPTGEYILAGSTDNCARVFSPSDGKCVCEIAEHNHYVQGVAWDPLNEYIATQSSDRSMHVYRISTKQGTFEAHAVGKNTRMSYTHNHSRTPSSHSRSRSYRHESAASDVESTVSDQHKDDVLFSGNYAPPTPTASVVSTPSTSMFPPPPVERPSSRRSSFSGSNAPGSPGQYARYGRSPSPMPPLPAIRALPSPAWSTIKLYGDESFSNFFRRLTFSPDGGLLLTPAGQFEDPSIITNKPKAEETPTRGRKSKLAITTSETNPSSASSVFIYSRANFARPPIAQLPGHKKASVAVKFSPVLYELRQDVIGAEGYNEPKTGTLEKGRDGSISVDIAGPSATPATHKDIFAHSLKVEKNLLLHVEAPTPHVVAPELVMPSSSLKPSTPSPSKPSTPAIAPPNTGSVFALPYRMLYAVLTMDAVAIYDTQQSGPVCMLTKLHYDEFTDASWSSDGQCLILSSRDGYCTIVIFDEILPAHHTQQYALQLQSIAQHNFVPLTYTMTPSSSSVPLAAITTPTVPAKRTEPPPTPATSIDDNAPAGKSAPEVTPAKLAQPPRKKRRLVLTKVGDIDS